MKKLQQKYYIFRCLKYCYNNLKCIPTLRSESKNKHIFMNSYNQNNT